MSAKEIVFDLIARNNWIKDQGESNSQEMAHVKSAVAVALNECCTETERKYIVDYFVCQMNQREIGAKYGVNRASVSRGIRRGLKKIYVRLRFASPALINQPQRMGKGCRPTRRRTRCNGKEDT